MNDTTDRLNLKNQPFEPRSKEGNPSQKMQEHGQIKAGKSVSWNMQKMVPKDIAKSVKEEREKRERRAALALERSNTVSRINHSAPFGKKFSS